ncbi:MAG TPA: type II toxin-antitoxin system RelE/ParE family toxin [Verrucomicrobiae bacterium]
MLHIVRHPEVSGELEAAALWYEDRERGLGTEFLDEYQNTLDRILEEPDRWRKIKGDNRKLNFRRFPYAIIYNVNATTLYIVAVMHLYRRPFYWSQRLRSK